MTPTRALIEAVLEAIAKSADGYTDTGAGGYSDGYALGRIHAADAAQQALELARTIAPAAPSPDRERVARDKREEVARIIYELDPFYEPSKSIDGFQVTCGGWLSWQQARNRDEFEGDKPPLTMGPYKAADAIIALTAADPIPIEREGWTIQIADRGDGGLRVWSDDIPGLILSGADGERVMACIYPAIKAMVWHSICRNGLKLDVEIGLSAAPVISETGWRDIASAPKDQIIMAWPCEIDGGAIVAVPASWYVHPSVQGWVTDVIDCSDYEFEPTHWLPAPPAKPSGVGEEDHGS